MFRKKDVSTDIGIDRVGFIVGNVGGAGVDPCSAPLQTDRHGGWQIII